MNDRIPARHIISIFAQYHMSALIAIIGIGHVGEAITTALLHAGYHVVVGARDQSSRSVRAAITKHPALVVDTIASAVARADFVFLCVPYEEHESAINAAGAYLAGKILVDCTNPVGPSLTHALGSIRSGTEIVQAAAPQSHAVKAFSVVGYENMSDPDFPGYGKALPAMFIAGDNTDAKRRLSTVLRQLGWEPVDCGGASSSLHLEHMTLLWIKLARLCGQGPRLAWALLRK
jgi:predicted dinucleotide-binding enzyme